MQNLTSIKHQRNEQINLIGNVYSPIIPAVAARD